MPWARENEYNEQFARASQTYGVPVWLLKSIAAAESEFNQNAYRYEPAINDASYGLMQVLYSTAHALGYTGTPDGLYNPQTNIDLGAKYLAAAIANASSHGWNLDSVLSVYNGGGSTDRPGDGKRETNRIDGYNAAGTQLAPFINQSYVDRVNSIIPYFRDQAQPLQTVTIIGENYTIWILLGVLALAALVDTRDRK